MLNNKLFDPIHIGTIQVKNRIVLPGMDTCSAAEGGQVTQELIDYHAERAKGGVGLLIVGNGAVSPSGKRLKHSVCIFDDSYVTGLSRLASEIKKYGAKAAIQLAHGGRECSQEVTGYSPVAPSSVRSAYSSIAETELPKTLSLTEIDGLVEDFAQAALRARIAGFDAVEIHGAHGYLISQFLSPATNLRTDQYGGTVVNRALFYKQIVQRCKKNAGADFPLIARLNWNDFAPNGVRLKDSLQIASILAEAGADAINVSAGIHASRPFMAVPGMMVTPGVNVEATAEFKKILKVPVIAVGRINEPQMAKEIVNSGKADLVALGRALIADPQWVNLSESNREKEIRMCIACNEGCFKSTNLQIPIRCMVNPAVLKEREFSHRLTQVKNKKTIAVVGGGPAGMEAARVAAQRGFKVILFEQNRELGGMVLVAAKAIKRHELINVVQYYQNCLPELEVDIRLGVRFNAALANSLNIDTVILATGSRFVPPPIPGVDKGHVVQANEVLTGSKETGKRCVVIGGGLTGVETAEHLAENGKKVMLVVRSSLAKNSPRSDFVYYEDRLKELDVDIHTQTTTLEIRDDGVLIEEDQWKKLIMGIDSVVLATGLKPDETLVNELKAVVPILHLAGDCIVPGRIINAVSGGDEAALALTE